MLDHLPPWPVISVVFSFLVLIAVAMGALIQKRDELENGVDETLERRIRDEGGSADR
jgi:hypothetical protein